MPVEAPPAAPATSPSPSAALAPDSQTSKTFAGLEALGRAPSTGSADNAPEPKAPSAPKRKETPKPDAKIAQPGDQKPPEKSPEPIPDETPLEDKPLDDKPNDPKHDPATAKTKKPSDFLREELARQKSRAEALEAEIKQYKTPKEDPEKKSLSERLSQEEKRRKEIEDELRFANYERSPEFKEKYVKPYEMAWAEAVGDLEETVVPNADGTFRKATKDDLMKIVNLPIQQAGELAEQLFGKAERTMMDHRSALLKTWKAQQAALVDGRKNAEERDRQLTEQATKQQVELKKLQSELRSSREPDFLKRHPELEIARDAKGEPVDAELQKTIDQDRTITDNLFTDDSKLAPEKKLELHAEMRNRASHFGAVLKMARNAMKEVADLKAKLAQYEGSEPTPGDGVKGPTPELREATTMTGVLDGLTKLGREKSGPF